MSDPNATIGSIVGVFLGGVTIYSYFADRREKRKKKSDDEHRDLKIKQEGELAQNIKDILGGTVVGTLGELMDKVTELAEDARASRRETQEADSQAKYQIEKGIAIAAMNEAILTTAAVAIIVADYQGNIIRWNDAACILFGYTSQEALRESVTLVIPHDMRAAHYEGYDRFRRTGDGPIIGRTVVVDALTKGGLMVKVSLTVSAWGEGPSAMVCAFIIPVTPLALPPAQAMPPASQAMPPPALPVSLAPAIGQVTSAEAYNQSPHPNPLMLEDMGQGAEPD